MQSQLPEDFPATADDEDTASVHSDESEDDAERLIELLDDSALHADVHRIQTEKQRKEHAEAGDLVPRIQSILHLMKEFNINLALFLSSILWESPELIRDHDARFQRTTLMKAKELPAILQRMAYPPSNHNKSGARGTAARNVMEEWAERNVVKRMSTELTAATLQSRQPPLTDFLSTTSLKGIQYQVIIKSHKQDAPLTWRILRRVAYTPKQEARNSSKSSALADVRVMSMVETAISTRSSRSGLLRRLHSIYLKSTGISSRAYHTLSVLGVCMQQNWTYGAIETMSELQMKRFSADFRKHPIVLSYDNVNLNHAVFEQRSETRGQRGHSDGTIGIGIVIKDSSFPGPSSLTRERLCEQRELGRQSTITAAEIMDLEVENAPKLVPFEAHFILECLLTSREFDISTYKHADKQVLAPPKPLDGLPTGPSSATEYYLFHAEEINEATIDGNDELLQALFKQLGLGDEDGRLLIKDLALPFVGDQLTVSRCRSLWEQLGDEENPYDRNDWQYLLCAFFHTLMNTARTLHAQYYCSNTGVGLAHACNKLLHRKHLANASIQGTFFHHLEELLLHVVTARFRDAWLQVSGCSSLFELRNESAERLVSLSYKIRSSYASNKALVEHDRLDASKRDAVFRQSIHFNRDLLHFVVLQRGIKNGDVGVVEAMIPRLLFRFIGTGSGNYTKEMLELLQGLRYEWPEEIRSFVRHYCILVNTTGRMGMHEPVDTLVEHADTFRISGPFASWERIGKLSPAIPALQAIKDHVDEQSGAIARGKTHTSPDSENDKEILAQAYRERQVHKQIPGRMIQHEEDRVDDLYSEGSVMLRKAVERWSKKRGNDKRGEKEDLEDLKDVSR